MTASVPVQDNSAGTRPASTWAPKPRLADRAFPLLAVAALIAIGMISTIWVAPHLIGRFAWSLPHDLWGTMIAADRLLHGQLSGLYTRPTGLITLPGGALILTPLAALIDGLGLSLRMPGPHNPQPVTWLLAGPYETAISGVALFAADAIAEHLRLAMLKRALLAAAGAVLLWNVSIRWGHPEDAGAVGLLLYAVLDLANGKVTRSGWLIGAAVAIQPLVVLSLPVLVCVLPRRRVAGFATRAALPGAVLLGLAAAANWAATWAAVTRQPNWPGIDHPTLWLPLATPLGHGAVAAGPVRLFAVAAACGCAVVAWRQAGGLRPDEDAAAWDARLLALVLWWVATTLALRSAFEPVMVAFYLWPVLAVALIASAATWWRLLAVGVTGSVLTFVSQSSWHGPWSWWVPIMGSLALVLTLARTPVSWATDLKEPRLSLGRGHRGQERLNDL